MNEIENESLIKRVLRNVIIVLCTVGVGSGATLAVFLGYVIVVYGVAALPTILWQKQEDDHLYYVFMGCAVLIFAVAATLGGEIAKILLRKLRL